MKIKIRRRHTWRRRLVVSASSGDLVNVACCCGCISHHPCRRWRGHASIDV